MTSAELVSGFLDWYLAANPTYAALAGAQGYDRTLGDFTESGILARQREAAAPAGAAPGGPGSRRCAEPWKPWECWKPREFHEPGDLRGLRGLRGRDRSAARHVHAARRDRVRGVARLAARPVRLRGTDLLLDVRAVPATAAPRADWWTRPSRGWPRCRTSSPPAGPTSTPRWRPAAGAARTGPVTDRPALPHRTVPGQVADEALRARLAAAAEPAAAAFDDLVEFLEGFRAAGTWRMGEELYSTLLREREMLGYGAAELHKRGQARLRRSWTPELQCERRRPLGSDDWRAAMSSAAGRPPADRWRPCGPSTRPRPRGRGQSRQERGAGDAARGRGVPGGAVGRSSSGRSSPSRALPGPPRAQPPRRDRRTSSCPSRPTASPEEQVRQRLRTNARAAACPRSPSTRPTPATTGTCPGWRASPAPRRAQGVPDAVLHRGLGACTSEKRHARAAATSTTPRTSWPTSRQPHLQGGAHHRRHARCTCGDMTLDEADDVHGHQDRAHRPAPPRAEVSRYCAWPTQAPSYLTGALEIDRIRDGYLAATGATCGRSTTTWPPVSIPWASPAGWLWKGSDMSQNEVVEARVLDALDEAETVRLLADLVRVPSVTGTDAESDLQHRCSPACSSRRAWTWTSGSSTSTSSGRRPGFPGTEAPRTEGYGVVGVTEGEGEPALVLQGHADVVPTGDPARWRAEPLRRPDQREHHARQGRLRHEGGPRGEPRRRRRPLPGREYGWRDRWPCTAWWGRRTAAWARSPPWPAATGARPR